MNNKLKKLTESFTKELAECKQVSLEYAKNLMFLSRFDPSLLYSNNLRKTLLEKYLYAVSWSTFNPSLRFRLPSVGDALKNLEEYSAEQINELAAFVKEIIKKDKIVKENSNVEAEVIMKDTSESN